MLERQITERILRWLEQRPGGHCLKLHGNAFQRKGEPDILHVEDGQAFFFEVKRSAQEKPEPIQAHRLGQWRAAGAVVAVVRSVEDVAAVLGEKKRPPA